MRQSMESWLSGLSINLSTRQEDVTLADIHGEDSLQVISEDGLTWLICKKCTNLWTMCFTHSEELGDHFSLEPLSSQDPLRCRNNVNAH
jgi:hypothetical protein